jgi:GntR family transcriptional regulator/MocR family aminotransferase
LKAKAGAILSSIRIDRSSKRKISIQLYMGLRDVILTGGLSSGTRLPATRTLASEIGVSRTTVIEAVDRLISEGLLEAKVGAGTFVSNEMEHRNSVEPSLISPKPLAPPKFSKSISKAVKEFAVRERLPFKSRAFVTALPALDEFPVAQWAKLSARHLRHDRDSILGYGEPYGLPRLRTAIASHLNASRGIHCDPEQIFVVSGAQEAFSLLSDTLLDAGDKVWFENPGAIGARNAFLSRGAELVPVSIDDDGLNVADGLLKAPDFRLAFVTPSHQQPLGKVMSLSRRLALLSAADNADAVIIEDDYDGDFYFGNQPLPTLKSIDTNNRVIYVGTFSKTLFPSLRLGFLLSPPSLVETMQMIFSSSLTGVPTWSQSIVADFMDEGYFATHIRTMRALYKERHDVLHSFAPMLEDHVQIMKASAGFHTVGYLSTSLHEDQFVLDAKEVGVELSPIGKYCISPIEKRGVVIGYGASNASQLEQGVTQLSQILSK